ncbi:hypothetical protein DFH09DRAFT_1177757 [Mycena vulgaris]|nr:hypothetical protein DFH09DRAFT_1177757 [Mycena vulgaris]
MPVAARTARSCVRLHRDTDGHEGTRAALIKNAKVLTGARNGTEVIYSSVPLNKGVVIAVGYIRGHLVLPENSDIMDAEDKWVSPGFVDAHSHLGLSAPPGLSEWKLAQGPHPPLAARHRRNQHISRRISVDGCGWRDDGAGRPP